MLTVIAALISIVPEGAKTRSPPPLFVILVYFIAGTNCGCAPIKSTVPEPLLKAFAPTIKVSNIPVVPDAQVLPPVLVQTRSQ